MFKLTTVLIIFFLALASFSAQAQMGDRLRELPSTDQILHRNAVALTRDMTNRLHLNEGQFLRLLPLNRTKLAGLSSINDEYRDDEAARSAKAAALEAQFEQECSRVLTPSQLSIFQQQQQTGQPTAAPANTGNGLG